VLREEPDPAVAICRMKYTTRKDYTYIYNKGSSHPVTREKGIRGFRLERWPFSELTNLKLFKLWLGTDKVPIKTFLWPGSQTLNCHRGSQRTAKVELMLADESCTCPVEGSTNLNLHKFLSTKFTQHLMVAYGLGTDLIYSSCTDIGLLKIPAINFSGLFCIHCWIPKLFFVFNGKSVLQCETIRLKSLLNLGNIASP
jgi:hypothetical protein